MEKLGLRFSVKAIENEYMRTREPFTKSFLIHLIAAILFFLIYSTVTTIVNHKPFTSYFLPILLAIAIFLLKFHQRLKRVMDLIIVVVCIVIYGIGLNGIKIFLQYNTTYMAFYIGYAFCLFQRLVEARIIKTYCFLMLYIGLLSLRLSLIRSDDVGALIIQIFLEILILISNFERERGTRKLFRLFYDYSLEFLKFKDLISNYIPANIVIFDNNLKHILFMNDAFKAFCTHQDITGIQAFMETLAIDLGSFEGSDALRANYERQGQSNNLKQVLYDFSMLSYQDRQNIIGFTVRFDAFGTQQEVFQTKILGLQWDNKEAIAVMFNNLTQQETIMKLQVANKHKDNVIATVSHELRTPINAILGLIKIMEGMISDPKILFHLSACKYSSKLLLNFVNSILDLTQVRGGCIKMYPTSFNLLKALDEIRRIFSFQCTQKGLEMIFDVSEDLPKNVYTDKNRLCQVIVNLLSNALKFTAKGSITLKVENDPLDEKNIVFSIIDTGIGIKEEDKEKLFKMYGRIEQSEKVSKTQGVGLGLTISNELVKLLNPRNEEAKITFDSQYEKGTIFTFSITKNLNQEEPLSLESIDDLSIHQEDQAQVRPSNRQYKFLTSCKGPGSQEISLQKLSSSERRSKHNSTRLKQDPLRAECNDTEKNSKQLLLSGPFESQIDRQLPETHQEISPSKMSKPETVIKGDWCLLVDDNPFNLMVARHVLEHKGYLVKTALNGKEAISTVENCYKLGEEFRFILMDCQMPVMDGFESSRILTEMMEKKLIPRIPIMALSANNSEEDIEMAKKAGMCEFLFKPLDEVQLVKVIELNARS